MERRRTLAAVTGVLVAATALIPGNALGDGNERPDVGTTTVSALTATGATVSATVDPNHHTTGAIFQWGPTTGYGSQTGVGYLTSPAIVRATLGNLTPATVYHLRAVAQNSRGVTYGADTTFTTPAAAPAAPATPVPAPAATPASPAPSTPAAPAAATADDAVMGRTMVVGTQTGTVAVRAPGAAGFQPLQQGTAIPMGATVDASRGTVRLTTEVPGGATQDALVRGARFLVRQARGSHGMTDLVLTGSELAACGKAHATAGAARTPRRSLWAKDSNGRFRSRGANSVATVRGTQWTTTDTCAGTTTRVTKGVVDVRDLHTRRTVTVRAGHSYLARAPRR